MSSVTYNKLQFIMKRGVADVTVVHLFVSSTVVSVSALPELKKNPGNYKYYQKSVCVTKMYACT
jgi:hypothetical protein